MIPQNLIQWSNSTFYFYLLIPISCFLISKVSLPIYQKELVVNNIQQKYYLKVGAVISSLILIIIKCISITGRDVQIGYQLDFDTANSLRTFRDPSIELGFRILNIVIHYIYPNYFFFLAVIGVLTVFPVIYFIFKYEDYINISLTFFAYATMYYIQGFSLLRIYLAASISLFSIDAIMHKKNKTALLWLIVAISIHQTSFILLFVYILYWCRNLNKTIIISSMSLFIILIVINRDFILQHFSGRYEIYAAQNSASAIGIAAFAEYVPLFILWWFVKKNYTTNYNSLIFYILLIGFSCSILSYSLSFFGRLKALLIAIVFIIGYYSKEISKKSKLNQLWIDLAFIVYGLTQLIIYINEYYNLDDIMPYVSYLGFYV